MFNIKEIHQSIEKSKTRAQTQLRQNETETRDKKRTTAGVNGYLRVFLQCPRLWKEKNCDENTDKQDEDSRYATTLPHCHSHCCLLQFTNTPRHADFQNWKETTPNCLRNTPIYRTLPALVRVDRPEHL